MNDKMKFFSALALLIFFPIAWESQQPWFKILGLGLFMILGVIWLVIRARKEDGFRIPKFLPFLLVYIVLLVILLSVTPIKTSGYYSIIFRLYILFFFIFIADRMASPDRRQFWENVLIGTGVVYASIDLLYVLIWFANWWSINGGPFPLPSLLQRAPGILLGHPNLQSSYLNLVTPFALVRLLSVKKRSALVFWCEILLILLVANFLTYSRGGWLSLAGALLVTLVLFYQPLWASRAVLWSKIQPRNLGKIWYVGGVILSIIVFGAGVLVVRLMQSTPHGTFSHRLDIYSYALRWISASPVYGHGTGSIPAIFALRGYAIGGDEVYHAHNTWLQITLKSGLLGLVLIILALCFILWGFRSSWIRWRGDPMLRASLAAYAGAGTAFLIHSIFDWVLWETGNALEVAILLALISSLALKKDIIILQKRYTIILLALLLLIPSAGFLFISRNNFMYSDGKAAAAEWDWSSARENLCRAADLSPENPFYSFQCSLANAHVAKFNQDTEALIKALQYQEQALDLDPNWYIHWANLSSYEWQLGEFESAITHMQKAVEMAPNRTFLQVNLAWMFEQSGDSEQAYKYYRKIYCINPGYQDTPIFQESSIFQIAMQEGCPEEYNRQAFIDPMWVGHQALEAGDLTAAEEYYQSAIPLNIQSGVPYALLALVHHQSGQIQEANRDLQIAFLIENNSAVNHEIAGRIALADGVLSKGYQHLYEAFTIRQNNSYSRMYYAAAYRDTGLLTDLSPYIPYSISLETRNLYEQLAAYLAAQGEHKKSQNVGQWLEIIKLP